MEKFWLIHTYIHGADESNKVTISWLTDSQHSKIKECDGETNMALDTYVDKWMGGWMDGRVKSKINKVKGT